MERIGIIFLGPPGSGKGTQAKELEKRFGFIHISTGDLLRKAVREGTPVGKIAEKYMKEGTLVPDDVIISLVGEALKGAEKFVLDGFPRNTTQAEKLEEIIQEGNAKISHVILLNVEDDEIVRRLLARRVCPSCGRVYNLITSPPKNDNKCDVCGVQLVKRSDDNEETIRKRLYIYRKETAPLIDYYKKKGLLVEVDASKDPEEVFRSILRIIGVHE